MTTKELEDTPAMKFRAGFPRVGPKETEVNPLNVNGLRPKSSEIVCNVCGKPSELKICDPCGMKIQLDAMARKMQEEKGSTWAKWESPDDSHRRRHSTHIPSKT